jgi:hypothetical protein
MRKRVTSIKKNISMKDDVVEFYSTIQEVVVGAKCSTTIDANAVS